MLISLLFSYGNYKYTFSYYRSISFLSPVLLTKSFWWSLDEFSWIYRSWSETKENKRYKYEFCSNALTKLHYNFFTTHYSCILYTSISSNKFFFCACHCITSLGYDDFWWICKKYFFSKKIFCVPNTYSRWPCTTNYWSKYYLFSLIISKELS